ncbi:MAG: GyrI-like domain-containing protein [Pseudomonadales bacterium]|nr:GyrI-like domain-containing protein [Pseudomonadales bacterium]
MSIVEFPSTPVAMIRHGAGPDSEHDTAMKLVQYKLQHKLLDQSRFRSYGLHHLPGQAAGGPVQQVDFCLSTEGPVLANDWGIVESVIPACRCAMARDIGSRLDNQAIKGLLQDWLPQSGEVLSGQPVIFHYVNVGPDVKPDEMITDVYLPLR